MAAAVRGWVQRTTAPLAREVRPVDLDPAGRRTALVGLALVAGGAATAKSALISSGRWSVGAQLGLVASVVVVAGGVLATHVAPGAGRVGAALRGLGLVPLPAPGDPPTRRPSPRTVVLVPLLLSGAVTAAGLVVRSDPGHLDASGLLDLVVLVAGAEELIHRGAVLALAHRALPPIAAELVTALAFGLSHLGNDGGWGRVVGPIVGGLVFSWLRHRSGSLAGPVAGHVATNLPGRVWGA